MERTPFCDLKTTNSSSSHSIEKSYDMVVQETVSGIECTFPQYSTARTKWKQILTISVEIVDFSNIQSATERRGRASILGTQLKMQKNSLAKKKSNILKSNNATVRKTAPEINTLAFQSKFLPLFQNTTLCGHIISCFAYKLAAHL